MLRWQELTIDDWIEIQSLISDDLTSSELALELELYLNPDFDDDITAQQLRDLRSKYEFVYHSPKKSNKALIHPPFKKMKLKTFIDLDTYLTKHKLFEVFDEVLELIFPEINLEIDIPICDVFYAVSDFLEFRKDIIERYKGIFSPDELDDEDELDEEFEEEEEVDESTPENKWGWLAVVYNMAGGDITKSDEVLNKSLISVLNWASMRYDFESRSQSKPVRNRR